MNTEIHERVRVKLGERSIQIIEEIQKLLVIEPLDTKKLEQLQSELDKTTDIFGKMTYPFWHLNKKE